MKCPFLLSIIFLIFNASSFAQNSRQRDIDAFISQTGAIATTDRATNSLNHLRFPIGQALNLEGNSAEQKALFFITKYSNLFERNTVEDSYQVKEIKRDNYGLDHVVLQQFHDRVPVYDGVLKFHFNKSGALTSLNGNFIIAENLDVTPSISAEEAGQAAIKLVTGQKMGKFAAPLKIKKNSLFAFQKGLAQGYKGTLHLVYEVEVRNDADVREFLYIDAHTNKLVEQFTGMHGIDRKLYETSISDPNLKWQETDGIGGAKYNALDQWQKSEIDAAGHIYNLMKNTFGYDSYDNAGAAMVTVHNDTNQDCMNASWNGTFAYFCLGFGSDDVVAHEWAHAYTEHTNGLVYGYQSGALNESYSDIWGETIDLLNGYMDSGEDLSIRTGCASSSRWQIGEATLYPNAFRDMWDPTCSGDPGKVSDLEFSCLSGVHVNSGILNHAYALLVDGGEYNGKKIQGLGLTKAAHILWQAQHTHLTRTTDFAAFADMLEASLIELIGINLARLTTEPSPGGLSDIIIVEEDLQQLSAVIHAVEMRSQSNCGFGTLFQTLKPLCKGALPENSVFYEDFEDGLAGWNVSNNGTNPSWIPRDWVIDVTPPEGRGGSVAFASDLIFGNCNTNLQSGVISLTSPEILISATSEPTLIMSFDHYISLEQGHDGGNVKYSIDSGPWKLVPTSAFTDNGYNTTLTFSLPKGNNPLLGQSVFSGGDKGTFSSAWGQSRINLTSLGISAGHKIQLRWDLGTDACDGWDGWYIDDVRIYTCNQPTVQFVSTTAIGSESDANIAEATPNSCLKYSEKLIKVKINSAPSQPVTVDLYLTNADGQPTTSDFELIPKSFPLQAGKLFQDVTIRIYNDAYVEGIETFKIAYNLSSPDGGNASPETFDQEYILTIQDDDFAPQNGTGDVVNANFTNGLPENWIIVDGGDPSKTWNVSETQNYKLDPSGPSCLWIRSINIPGKIDKVVETNTFNSIGMSNLSLSFLEHLYIANGGFPEQAIVDVWDGKNWQNLLTENEATGNVGKWNQPFARNLPIPNKYANAAMKIRFRYIANSDYWWAIDNVKVSGKHHNGIHSGLSATPDQQYLGPNATVHFRDPASGDLIAKIKNLTAHDYGCTSVEVDRAGIDKTAWVGGYKITNKTFKVTPTNGNPNGHYEITLYYKASELVTFNGSNIKSMGKSEGSIAQGTLANSVTTPFNLVMLNSDFAYTATFTGGFSGFGLSDAPAGSALPVTLSKFEGKNTAEGNVLLWETEAEMNNDYFAVQRSRDGRIFEEIARIPGIGASAIRSNYSFNDSGYESGLNYYRLKQVDRDSSFAYSRMIGLDAPYKNELKFFPNPVQSVLMIELRDTKVKEVNVKIINSVGQAVLTKHNVKSDKGRISLEVSKLPTGIYEIVLSDDETIYKFSIMKTP